MDEADPNIAYLKMTDIAEIYSNSGNVIQQSAGAFKLEVGAVINPFSCYFGGVNVQQDLQLLARSVKASGFEGITMNVDFSTPKLSQARAQQAYRACIEAGFPPEKITINIQGAPKKAEELFAEKPHILQQLHKQSQQIRAQLPTINLNQASSNEEIDAVRNKTQQIRSDLAAARAAKNKPDTNQSIKKDISSLNM